jgi:hypothetical protein
MQLFSYHSKAFEQKLLGVAIVTKLRISAHKLPYRPSWYSNIPYNDRIVIQMRFGTNSIVWCNAVLIWGLLISETQTWFYPLVKLLINYQINHLFCFSTNSYMGRFTGGGGGLGGLNPFQNLSNPFYKVFIPTKILLLPFYFVWKFLTLTLNPCRGLLSGATLAPHQNFFYILKKMKIRPWVAIMPIMTVQYQYMYHMNQHRQPRTRPSIFIFLIFSAFSHEKTGTRWFGGGAEEGHKPDASEEIEGLVDFPTTRPKLPWNCPGCEMRNYCVLKQNDLQLNSEFKPIQVQ